MRKQLAVAVALAATVGATPASSQTTERDLLTLEQQLERTAVRTAQKARTLLRRAQRVELILKKWKAGRPKISDQRHLARLVSSVTRTRDSLTAILVAVEQDVRRTAADLNQLIAGYEAHYGVDDDYLQ